MSIPAPAPITIPDHRGPARRAWLTAFFICAGLALLGAVAMIPVFFISVADSTVAPFFALMGVLAVLILLMIVAVIVVWSQRSGLVSQVSDALTLAGHPGVDARRLVAGQRVASPAGYWLRLRRESNASGHWLLVDRVG